MLARVLPLVLVLAACGGSVVVEDDTDLGLDPIAGSGGGWVGEGGSDAGCMACSAGACGWCAYEGGTVAYRCRSDGPPTSSMACVQTGNVYHDEQGPYVCWRCDPR